MGIEIGRLRDDEAERHWDMCREAFGWRDAFDPDRPRLPAECILVARDDGRPVATVGWYDTAQFLGGSRLAFGGVTMVMVMPEARRAGLAKELLARLFSEMVDGGAVISGLYPTTGRLYRSVGFEMAGIWARSRVRLDALPGDVPAPDESFEATEWSDPDLRRVHESMALRHDGWIARPDVMWARLAHDAARARRPSWLYRLRRDGETVGWIAYDYGDSTEQIYSVDVRHVFAVDTASLRRLLALVASSSATADTATFVLPLPLLALCVEHAHRITRVGDWVWMSRILDAPAAVAARGWPPGLDAEIPLALRDPFLAANDGTWMLVVRDGEGRLEPAPDVRDALEMGIGTLSSLFGGWADPFVVAASGAISGETERRLASLQACFAGPQPTLVDFF